MKTTGYLTRSQQTAGQIRAALEEGTWSGKLPGVRSLAVHFGVSRDTVREAVRLLQRDGWLTAPGTGKARQIHSGTTEETPVPRLRVGLLMLEPLATDNAFWQDFIHSLLTLVQNFGHECFIAPKSQIELRRSVRRVAKMVSANPADAWMVFGAARDLVDWFANQTMPFYSLGGSTHRHDCAMGNHLASPGLAEIINRMFALGHERIVFVSPSTWRIPAPSATLKMFTEVMGSHGLSVGSYHVPDWDETPAGLKRLMDNLFRITPPTAILTVEPSHCFGVLGYLAEHRLRIPQDVSLATMQHEPMLMWHSQSICRLEPDMAPLRRHVQRWLASLQTDSPLREAKTVPAKLIWGHSIGPAKK